jgi:hypothetical protein
MIKTEKQKEWSKKISKFKTSGKTKEVWCKENKISIRQFNYWLRWELQSSSTKNACLQWVSVEIKQEEISKSLPLQIQIGSAKVEVYPDFDKEHLLDVLKVLKSL